VSDATSSIDEAPRAPGVARVPALTPEEASDWVRRVYGIDAAASGLPSDRDQNFLLESAGARHVLRISQQGEAVPLLEAQNAMAARLSAVLPYRFPQAVASRGGREVETLEHRGVLHAARLVEYVPGVPLATVRPQTPALLHGLGRMLGAVDHVLAEVAEPALQRDFHWDLRRGAGVVRSHFGALPPERRALVERWLALFDAVAAPLAADLRMGIIHADANDWNVIVEVPADPLDPPVVAGLIDFGDAVRSWVAGEAAIAAAYAMLDKRDPLAAARAVVSGYHAENPLTDVEIAALFPLIGLRLCMSVTLAAHQRALRPDNAYLSISERPAWALLEQLEDVHARLAHFTLRDACGLPPVPATVPVEAWLASHPLLPGVPAPERPAPGADAAGIRARREARIGPSLGLSYHRPLHIVRGWMQHLYDADGQAYLDCVNNVAHVGHCHPQVVEALARQSRVLNTNTRYLHEKLVRYAERLTATLPEPLGVCYFVCSGSEANELALRLARTHTGRRDVVVLDAAYHGNTSTLVELSPYKFDGPGGSGAPAGTHVVPLPDPYRGRHRGADTGAEYAEHVREAVAAADARGGVAAFFAESLPGCGGQIVPPDGFLAAAFRHVRDAGGVCVVDEVQTGFGRVGSHFWGFETHGVVPDIVTMGKPIGNGHPLGAVVTTPEIASSFANGMEYFNTFGGNPVSCAVGLAVLDVIADEGLQLRALRVGGQLLAGLRELAARHVLIGDVRGRGLFVGVELVHDRETREPAGRHASYVVERMRDHRILLSTDGPDHNVIKIKPPLQFSAADADRLVATLDVVLAENAARP
jgi:4-aminobutyrate aminotransferase-like enzyme/Ser/Thr protein kinase RdoA (MazF antagonist)